MVKVLDKALDKVLDKVFDKVFDKDSKRAGPGRDSNLNSSTVTHVEAIHSDS